MLSASRDYSEQATIDERRTAREARNDGSVDRLFFVDTDPTRPDRRQERKIELFSQTRIPNAMSVHHVHRSTRKRGKVRSEDECQKVTNTCRTSGEKDSVERSRAWNPLVWIRRTSSRSVNFARKLTSLCTVDWWNKLFALVFGMMSTTTMKIDKHQML